jgi:hypothetical protein
MYVTVAKQVHLMAPILQRDCKRKDRRLVSACSRAE